MKQLSAKFVREVTEPGRYYDGDAGLFLLVADGVREMRKSYVQRVTVAGKRVDIGLGGARWLTLTEARAAAQANRKIARMGGDPRFEALDGADVRRSARKRDRDSARRVAERREVRITMARESPGLCRGAHAEAG